MEEEEQKRIRDGLDDLFDAGTKMGKYLKVLQREQERTLKKNYELAGQIISCHLVIENLLSEELDRLGILSKKQQEEGKPTFYQKLQLLPTEGKIYSGMIPGIEEVNRIRNKVAHKILFDPETFPIPEINKIFKELAFSRLKNLDVKTSVYEFTKLCMIYFNMRNPQITKIFAAYQDKYPGMKNFFSVFS